ncbi:hypothetical protein JYG23_12010 [Sedimentibacter sp. zth1]|uniref:hypothetical protein n=1 Tax=Sedimentibacter sp. zth1 TaxID=2816908 RepID=UPI001A9323C3|nr:hypothetical protein [Sedimentibacter sp. zth1]QSX05392.1 hypothetical protein JYG23_12010 [Sedimentibacter sp. zth1]
MKNSKELNSMLYDNLLRQINKEGINVKNTFFYLAKEEIQIIYNTCLDLFLKQIINVSVHDEKCIRLIKRNELLEIVKEEDKVLYDKHVMSVYT